MTLSILLTDHLECAFSQQSIPEAQQDLPNSFPIFLTYIICHILSLASMTGGRCYRLEIPFSFCAMTKMPQQPAISHTAKGMCRKLP